MEQLSSSRQGVWSLTAKGKSLIKDNNIDVKDITRFSSRKKNETSDDIITEEKKNWREQITDILQNINPYAFERLAQRLLRECGFTDVKVTQKTGDGGIDGTGKLQLQGIFSFYVAFQCKRYKGKVGTPEIRDFRGSLGTTLTQVIARFVRLVVTQRYVMLQLLQVPNWVGEVWFILL